MEAEEGALMREAQILDQNEAATLDLLLSSMASGLSASVRRAPTLAREEGALLDKDLIGWMLREEEKVGVD